MITPNTPVQEGSVANHYDALDVFYRDLWGEHVHHGLWLTGDESPEQAVEQLVHHVAQAAAVRPGDAVCDVGCGYGATARMLAREYQAHVTALTISTAQHALAQSVTLADHNPTYLLRDWMANDLPSASFDAVIAIESVSHMHDKRRCFAEAARVLRPGGRLVVCAWLAAEQPPPWAVQHLLEPICREGRLPGLGSRSEYETWIAAAGFRRVAFNDWSRQVRKTWRIGMMRLIHRLITQPSYRRYLLDVQNMDRQFALTMLRIWAAYYVGALRYGLFTAHKPLS